MAGETNGLLFSTSKDTPLYSLVGNSFMHVSKNMIYYKWVEPTHNVFVLNPNTIFPPALVFDDLNVSETVPKVGGKNNAHTSYFSVQRRSCIECYTNN